MHNRHVTPTNPASAPVTRSVPLAISLLLLLVGFGMALLAVPFLAFQAWYAFTDHLTITSTIWGTACLVPLLVMFGATPIATTRARCRGSTWSKAVLAGAAVVVLTAGAGIGLCMVAAVLGGM